MDHYHYARWCSVPLMDLIQLDINCPDIYSKFSNGNFPFKKQFVSFQKWPQIRSINKTMK